MFGLTGTGYFDMVAYEKFHDGEMSDYIPTDADLAGRLRQYPKIPRQRISEIVKVYKKRAERRSFCSIFPARY